MYVGMRVTISGLSSRPELNGMTGTALSFESAKGRYAVQLTAGDRVTTVGLKAANLSLAADEDEQAAPIRVRRRGPTTKATCGEDRQREHYSASLGRFCREAFLSLFLPISHLDFR